MHFVGIPVVYIFKMVKLEVLQQPEDCYCCDTFILLTRFLLLNLKPVCCHIFAYLIIILLRDHYIYSHIYLNG